MTNIHKLSGIVNIGGVQYEWELRSKPQWSESEGWNSALMHRTSIRQRPTAENLVKCIVCNLQRGNFSFGKRGDDTVF